VNNNTYFAKLAPHHGRNELAQMIMIWLSPHVLQRSHHYIAYIRRHFSTNLNANLFFTWQKR